MDFSPKKKQEDELPAILYLVLLVSLSWQTHTMQISKPQMSVRKPPPQIENYVNQMGLPMISSLFNQLRQ